MAPPATADARRSGNPRRRNPPRPPVCGRTLDGRACRKRGDHLCKPRADHVTAFFRELLVHTKARWARKTFDLEPWQADEIVRPVFGTVVWDTELGAYVRRYQIVWIEVARKNGKAVDTDEPILTQRGWVRAGDLTDRDSVHAPDGRLVPILATGPIHERDAYRVSLADGRSVVASDEHEWIVRDSHGASRRLTTLELRDGLHSGTRRDRAWRIDVPGALRRPTSQMPVDPYLLGAWLGDGTTARGEITTMDPEVVDAIAAAGWATSYVYERGRASTYGIPGLGGALRDLGVLGDKHIPETYLLADEPTRRALLAGLLDTDGGVTRGPNTRIEFTGRRRLVDDVVFLARSLGFKPGTPRPHNGSWRTGFTAYRGDGCFRIPRKRDALAPRPPGHTRSSSLTVATIEPVGRRMVRCIQVEGGMFLAGPDLIPTHNSEVLAGIALYLLCADDEASSEVYGCAKDRDQARKVFDVAQPDGGAVAGPVAAAEGLQPGQADRRRAKRLLLRGGRRRRGREPGPQPARHRVRRGADPAER